MTDNTKQQSEQKADIIDLSAKRKQHRQKAREDAKAQARKRAESEGRFSLSGLSFTDGKSTLTTIFQLLVFLLVVFFFMRECGGGM